MTTPPPLLAASADPSLPLSPTVDSRFILVPCRSIPSPWALDTTSQPDLVLSKPLPLLPGTVLQGWSLLQARASWEVFSTRHLPGNSLGCSLEAGIPGCHRKAFPSPTSKHQGFHTSQTRQLSFPSGTSEHRGQSKISCEPWRAGTTVLF